MDGGGSYWCECVPGYTGPNCEVDVDDCASMPCVNGGTCVDGVNEFTCECADGFAGDLCDLNIDDCASSPCAPSATCIDGIASFLCECAAGDIGELCDASVSRYELAVADTVGAGESLVVTVRATTEDGRLVDNWAVGVAVVVTAAGGDGAELLVEPLELEAGVGVFATVLYAADDVTVALRDTQSTGLAMDAASVVTVHPQAAQAVRLAAPTTANVDDGVLVTLSVVDEYGNVIADGGDVSVTLAVAGTDVSGDGAVVTLQDGGAVVVVGSQAVGVVTVSTVDSHSTGLDLPGAVTVAFSSGAAVELRFDEVPSGVLVSAPARVTVRVLDQYRNLVADYPESQLALDVEAGSLPSGDRVAVTLRNGVGEAEYTSTVAEPVTFAVDDESAGGLGADSTVTVVFLPGAASQMFLLADEQASVDDGALVTVRVADVYGNRVTQFSTTVMVVATSAVAGSTSVVVSVSQGVGVGLVRLTVPGDAEIALLDSLSVGLATGEPLTVRFVAGAAAAFVLDGPTTASVDDGAAVDVRVVDQFGNTVDTFGQPVWLATADGLRQWEVPVTGGAGDVLISSQVPSTLQLVIADRASLGLDAGVAHFLVFYAGSAVDAVLTELGSAGEEASVDAPVSVGVRVRDQFGNTASAFEGGFLLATSAPSATGSAVAIIAS